MVEEIPTTQLSLSLTAINKLGGLENAKNIFKSGKFEVKFKGSTKTWSILFNGNQHVEADFVKNLKVKAMYIVFGRKFSRSIKSGVQQ